ncbi:MAG: minor capsid protein [Eubacteriales bacterium]|nr:minor capsid protein [Eubacteriales bacterium]
MKVNVKVDFKPASVQEERQRLFDTKVLPVLTQQIIKDSNIYCRQDQGTLIASSMIASQPSKGLAVWDTPYAKRVYYTGNPCKDINPNASLMWYERAKQRKKKNWLLLVEKGMK